MQPTPRQHSRFTRILLATAALATLALCGFNAWVDPYGIYRQYGVPTAGLPEVTWSRIAAAERLLAEDCDTVIIGSSRGVFGFGTRPIDLAGQRICNGSIGGTSMLEIREVARLVSTQAPAKHIIVLTDLELFHDGRGLMHDFAQSRFNTERTPTTFALWSLTSLSTIEDSLATLGIRTPFFEPPPQDQPTVTRNRRAVRVTLSFPGMLRAFEGPDRSLDQLEELLDEAITHGKEVTLVLPSIHAMELHLYDRAGMWEANARWRVWLAETAAERGLPIWDFATFHDAARTKLPLSTEELPNPWYIDITHQSMMLGDLTLERLFLPPDASTTWDPRFGVKLTPDGMGEHLDALDRGLQTWRREQPEDLAWFEDVAEAVFTRDPSLQGELDAAAAQMNARLPPRP